MGIWSWTIQVDLEYNHLYHRREATHTHRRRQYEDKAEEDVKTDLKISVMQPQIKEHQEPPETGRLEELILSQGLWRESSPTHSFISTQRYQWCASGLQNHENRFLLSSAVKLLEICYSSHGKLMHSPMEPTRRNELKGVMRKSSSSQSSKHFEILRNKSHSRQHWHGLPDVCTQAWLLHQEKVSLRWEIASLVMMWQMQVLRFRKRHGSCPQSR